MSLWRIPVFFLIFLAYLSHSAEDDKKLALEAQLAQAEPGSAAYGELLVSLVRHCWYRCSADAEQYGEQALEHFANQPDIDQETILAGFLPRIYIDRGQNNKAQEILDTVLTRKARPQNSEDWARALANQGILYKRTGQYLLAEEIYLQSIDIFSALENSGAVGNLYNNLATISQSQGNLGQALEYYNLALPLVEQAGRAGNIMNTLLNIATVYSSMGDEAAAFRFLQRAEALDVSQESLVHRIERYQQRARIGIRFGQLEMARESAQRGLDASVESSYLHTQVVSHLLLGEVAELQGNDEEARQQYLFALDRAGQLESVSLLNDVRVVLAKFHQQAGRYREARKLAEATVESGEALRHDDDVMTARQILATSVAALGDTTSAFAIQSDVVADLKAKYAQDRQNNLAQLATLFKQQEQAQTITELERDNAQKALEVSQERQARQQLFWLGGSLLLVMLVLTAFLLQRRKLLRVRADMAQAMVERKNRMLTEISHELRTPLAAIKLQLEMLEHNLAESPTDTHKLLHQKIDSLNRLISDVFQLSKADAGEMEFVFRPVLIGPYLENWARANAYLMEDHQLAFEQHIDIPHDVLCECDIDRISQVLSNLLSNSCRYTQAPGKVIIRSWIERDQWIFLIQDSSPGVADESLEHLFERLYRADASRNRALGGSGLGLSICRALIEGHQGRISARSSDIGGVSIRFVVPLEQPE